MECTNLANLGVVGVMRMAETEREKNLKSVDEFRMFDDTFMSAVFDGKIEETQFLIKVILGRDDITVIDSKAQFSSRIFTDMDCGWTSLPEMKKGMHTILK